MEKLLNYLLNKKFPEVDYGIYEAIMWLERFICFFEEDYRNWLDEEKEDVTNNGTMVEEEEGEEEEAKEPAKKDDDAGSNLTPVRGRNKRAATNIATSQMEAKIVLDMF